MDETSKEGKKRASQKATIQVRTGRGKEKRKVFTTISKFSLHTLRVTYNDSIILLTIATMAKPDNNAEVLDVAFNLALLRRRRRQERTMEARWAGEAPTGPEVESQALP